MIVGEHMLLNINSYHVLQTEMIFLIGILYEF